MLNDAELRLESSRDDENAPKLSRILVLGSGLSLGLLFG